MLGIVFLKAYSGVVAAKAIAIPGTENAWMAFFSPDGPWLGFFANGKLQRVHLGGGNPIPIVDAPGSTSATWLPNETIIYVSNGKLFRVSTSVGKPELLLSPDSSRTRGHLLVNERFTDPQILPGGRSLLFTIFSFPFNPDSTDIAVLNLETSEYKTILKGGYNARYAQSGHLIYRRGDQSQLVAAPFDLRRLEVRGSSVPVALGADYYGISETGSLVYGLGEEGRQFDLSLVWVDMTGREQLVVEDLQNY